MTRTIVIMPTYNERENLESIVGRLSAACPDVSLLVVDDGSPDGTGEIADGLAAQNGRVSVLHREAKEGLGAAYRAGFAWAIAQGFEVIVEMDADGSHRPEELHRLLEAITEADVVVGSRWVPGGSVIGWPLRRRFLSRGGSAYARLALGVRQRDVTGGYRAYRAAALERVIATASEGQGYCFQVELLWQSARAGLRIAEVPITFSEREHGYSKMSGNIVWEAMSRITAWGVHALPERIGIRSGRTEQQHARV